MGLLLCMIITNYSKVYSQNSLGTGNSNYSPSNGVLINPTNMTNSKTFLDVNLVGYGIYGNNQNRLEK